MRWFRLMADDVQEWYGKAYDEEHALEKAFSDEPPGSLVTYELHKWVKRKSGSFTVMKWEKVKGIRIHL